jgi:hypothetical protein
VIHAEDDFLAGLVDRHVAAEEPAARLCGRRRKSQ